MNIGELKKVNIGVRVHLEALVSNICKKTKKNGSSYGIVTIQDNTDIFTFPIWEDFDKISALIHIGKLIEIDSVTSTYNGNMQFSNPSYKQIENPELLKSLIPRYKVPQEAIDKFLEVITNMESPYKELTIEATGAFETNEKMWNMFITCPAAEKHHGNKIGGLFWHTYGVLKAANNIIRDYNEDPFMLSAKDVLVPSKLRMLAILHDIKKTQEYLYEDGCIRRKDIQLDHLVMGAAYVCEINNRLHLFSEKEIDDIQYSILSHHGQWGKFAPVSIYDKLLHECDMVDGMLVGEIEK